MNKNTTSPDNLPSSREALIAALTDDLVPVRRVNAWEGALLIALATCVAAIGAIVIFEFWNGIVSGEASAIFWIVNGLLLLLGAASTSALASSALPRVGTRTSAPLWGAAMLSVVPAAALITLFSAGGPRDAASGTAAAPVMWHWECTAYGVTAGLLVAIASVMFLRRGAPVAIERAGWLTGLAMGALGSVAYGITCPLDTIAHVGVVHVAPVAIGAVLGRLIVPPLIRW